MPFHHAVLPTLALLAMTAWSQAGEAVVSRKQFKQSASYPFVFRAESYLATNGPAPMRFRAAPPACAARTAPPLSAAAKAMTGANKDSNNAEAPAVSAGPAPAYPPPAAPPQRLTDEVDLNRVPDEVLDFYGMLARLDLPPESQAQVHLKLVHCAYLLDDLPGAVEKAQKFLEKYPDHFSVPECRYLLASALRGQKRNRESFEVVITLLRKQKVQKEKAPEQWVFWQKKAGNEFANTYYNEGEIANALTIYQTLARLNEDADWQWPVIYQMGLCFERLRLTSRAAEAYKFIPSHGC